MTTINTDWEPKNYTLLVDGIDYDVRCFVYLRLKEVPDEYSRSGHDTQVADYTLEGWECLPTLAKPSHEQEIEKQLLMRLEEEFAP